jgi:hypothetical protein
LARFLGAATNWKADPIAAPWRRKASFAPTSGLPRAALAAAAQDNVVVCDLKADPVRDLADGALKGVVLEGDHPPTVPTDRVVMVPAAGLNALKAGRTPRHLDPLDQPELLERLEGAVDAGTSDPRLAAAQLVLDLKRSDRAVVAPEHLDHSMPRATPAVSGARQR